MSDTISKQEVIDALYDWSEHSMTDAEAWHMDDVRWKYGIPPASNANFAWIQHINAAGRAAT